MSKKEPKPSDKRPIKERLLDALRYYETYVDLEGMRTVKGDDQKAVDIILENGQWGDITEATPTTVIPSYDDEGEEMTIGDFLELTHEVQAALKRPDNFTDGSILTSRRLLVYVDFVDSLSRSRMDKVNGAILLDKDASGISVKFSFGFSAFTLAMMVKGHHLFSKYYPPVSRNEHFIEVLWDEDRLPNESTRHNYVEAMIFALHEELGISVLRCARAVVDEGGDDVDYEGQPTGISRPLMIGPGMPQLLAAYNKSHEPGSREYEFLQIAKTVEFVAATVARKVAHQEVRKRLHSPEALRPNAAYISGLINLILQQQAHQKDGEVFKMTIEQCCDAQALAAVAPDCAKRLVEIRNSVEPHQKKSKLNAEAQKAALTELAIIMYSTRCQFAHEKANYTPKGEECPEDQLAGLIACARLAARQCIRWYNDLGERECLF